MQIESLDPAALPAAFVTADQAAVRSQRTALSFIRLQLLCGIVAAAAGVGSWRWEKGGADVLAAVGVLAFAGALYFSWRLADGRALRRWYEARAAAESLKTLAWRYAVGADPFRCDSPDGADEEFVRRLRDVLERLHHLDVPLKQRGDDQITSAMRDLRASPLEVRKEVYGRGRVQDQMAWYRTKAAAHAGSQRRWARATMLANGAGMVAALARLVHLTGLDLLGVLAVVAASATAWSQARQHGSLVAAYSVAEHELRLVMAMIPGIPDELRWAGFVADSEEAISREHTMWLASRVAGPAHS